MLLNQPRAIQFMQQYALDAIVATAPVNVTYFTDYCCGEDFLFKEYMASPGASTTPPRSYAILPLQGEPALVLRPAFALNACDSWIQDLHFYGDFALDWSVSSSPHNDSERRFVNLLRNRPRHSTAIDALLYVLREQKLDSACIGLDSENLPTATLDAIRNGLPRANIKNCSNLIRVIRAVKSPEEIKRLIRAAEINEQAILEIVNLARPGASTADLAQSFRRCVAGSGADFDHISFGARGLSIFTEPNYHLVSNDVLFMDFGCIYGHYFSDSAVTLAVGDISSLLVSKYEALRDCIDSGSDIMRPGVRGSEIQAAMAEKLRDHGITGPFPHGHGIGMEMRDYPIIVPDNGLQIRDDCVDLSSDLLMEEGMVNNLEVSIFLPMVGSVGIEESFLVAGHGVRPLIPQDRRAPFVAECI